MLKKQFVYTDFNGNERKEDHYFNLTKAEVMRMEMGVKGGLAEMIQRLIDAQDAPAILDVIEDLIDKTYGVKDADGKGFVKRKADLDAFKSTEAYSMLYMELATDADAAAKFINGVMPSDVDKQNVQNVKHPAAN